MPVSELTGIGCYRKQYLSELVISVVRVEVGDAELASGLFDSPRLFDQRSNGVTHHLIACRVAGSDQLVEVLTLVGVINDDL